MGLEDDKPEFERIKASRPNILTPSSSPHHLLLQLVVLTVLSQSQADKTLYWTQQRLDVRSMVVQVVSSHFSISPLVVLILTRRYYLSSRPVDASHSWLALLVIGQHRQ